jgi:hypothetical protein
MKPNAFSYSRLRSVFCPRAQTPYILPDSHAGFDHRADEDDLIDEEQHPVHRVSVAKWEFPPERTRELQHWDRIKKAPDIIINRFIKWVGQRALR